MRQTGGGPSLREPNRASDQKPPAKPVEQKVTLAGFPVTEYSLRKFVQIQLPNP